MVVNRQDSLKSLFDFNIFVDILFNHPRRCNLKDKYFVNDLNRRHMYTFTWDTKIKDETTQMKTSMVYHGHD